MTLAFIKVTLWAIYTRARIAVSGNRSVLAASGLTIAFDVALSRAHLGSPARPCSWWRCSGCFW